MPGNEWVIKSFGPKCRSSEGQEEQLCEIILQMEANLYGLAEGDICSIMYKFRDKYGIENKFNTKNQKAGKKWFRVFIERPISHWTATVNTSAYCQGKKVRRVAHASIVSSSTCLMEFQEAKQITHREASIKRKLLKRDSEQESHNVAKARKRDMQCQLVRNN